MDMFSNRPYVFLRNDDRTAYIGDGYDGNYFEHKRTERIYARRHKSTAHNNLFWLDSWFFCINHSGGVLQQVYLGKLFSADSPFFPLKMII